MYLFFISFDKGETITSFIPVADNNLLKAVIIEIIRIIGKSSVIAYKNPLKTDIIEEGIDFVLYNAIESIPSMQIIVISFFLKIDIKIKTVKII